MFCAPSSLSSVRESEEESGMKSSNSGHGQATIPAAAKKVVQSLKEIVKKHSDEEIYAALKDCDMDPNLAVHVLMNQDTFHEVKRKRDKRRENGSNNDSGEAKARAVSRLEHVIKRANYVPRHLLNDGNAVVKSKFAGAHEDSYRTDRVGTGTNPLSASQTKPSISRMRNAGSVGLGQRPSRTYGTTQTSRGSWTRVSEHASSGSFSAAAPSMRSSMPASASARYETAKRQELAVAEADRDNPKQEGGTVAADVSSLKPVLKSNPSSNQRSVVSDGRNSAGFHHENARSHGPRLHQNILEDHRRNTSARPYFQNYHNIRASYQPHQQFSGAHRAVSALEWKPKPPPTPSVVVESKPPETLPIEEAGGSPPPAVSNGSSEVPAETISKLEALNLLDEPPVIIPEHLQVPEADCAGLSFGSFDTDFDPSFTDGLNDTKSLAVEEISTSAEVVVPVETIESSVKELPPVETSTATRPPLLPPTTPETFATSSDAVLSMPAVAGRVTAEIAKPEIHLQQQGRQFSVPSVSNYQSLGGVPQSQYLYDTAESQPQEISRSSIVQPLAESAPHYYSPVFRPGSDGEGRYQFLSSHGASKFGGNVALMNGQSLSSSQEQSQNAGVPHSTTLAVGQPSIPLHAYAAQPAGVPLSPYPTNIYGYQYVPPNYAYMHAPYQNSYPGNNGYHQPPIGSSFAPSTRVYPPAGTATIKFPPPQFKLGTGNGPHTMVAAGYGSYATAPSGFSGINSSVTAGSASSYEDMIGSHYKENNIFTSSQQVEGSGLWIQGPVSRDVPGMQTNSFYNLHGPPGQHAGYTTHSQAAHTHHATGFASYPQSAPGPSNHQLLQQPQALGSVGTGSQAVIFPQPQRGPVNWTNNYSNFLRSQ